MANEHWAQPDPNYKHNPPKFPGYRFGPGGKSAVFNSEDEVPEGWTDNPNDHIGKEVTGQEEAPPPPVLEGEEDDFDRDEVIELLTQAKVDFNNRWPTTRLNRAWREYLNPPGESKED